MFLRLAALVVPMVLLGVPAQAYDTPRALVEAIYASYTPGGTPPAPESYFSRALKYQYTEKLAREGDDSESLGFDPFVNGQDYLLHDLKIAEPTTIGDRAMVNVTFYNFDEPTALTFALISENGDWRVDDLAAMGTERHWLLSWLFSFDPFAIN